MENKPKNWSLMKTNSKGSSLTKLIKKKENMVMEHVTQLCRWVAELLKELTT